jgi:DNA-binding transcriptional LysR family regulator
LSLVQEAESAAGEIRQRPRGGLNINAPVTYCQYVLQPIISRFLAEFPEVKIDLSLSDKFVDIIEGGYDLGIRKGSMRDSSLRPQQIGTTKLCVHMEIIRINLVRHKHLKTCGNTIV